MYPQAAQQENSFSHFVSLLHETESNTQNTVGLSCSHQGCIFKGSNY